MTHRTLIVARMDPADATEVSSIFRRSDSGPLPEMVGVVHRSLFRFGPDLYLHYMEAKSDVATAIGELRTHPQFVEVNGALEKHVTAFDPTTWTSPKDAMAECFYRWDRPGRRL